MRYRSTCFANLSGWLYLGATIIVANYVTGSYGLEIRLSRFNMVVTGRFRSAWLCWS